MARGTRLQISGLELLATTVRFVTTLLHHQHRHRQTTNFCEGAACSERPSRNEFLRTLSPRLELLDGASPPNRCVLPQKYNSNLWQFDFFQTAQV